MKYRKPVLMMSGFSHSAQEQKVYGRRCPKGDGLPVPVVEVMHVTKVYRQGDVETRVLEDVSICVRAADYLALMGPSGSGKSTLLNLISGLDTLTAGDIRVGGQSITDLSEAQLARWRRDNVGFVFQQYHLMPVLSALQNVELPLRLFDMSARERRERAEAALEIVGLSDRLQSPPRRLSGGQQQRVSIARAIVTDPLILIADEPTGNLDVHASEEVLDLFDTLNRDMNKTILMVTHDPRAAARARRVLHLDKGVLLTSDSAPPLPAVGQTVWR